MRSQVPLQQRWYEILKRLIDLAAALFLLVIFSPLILLIALAVLADDGRPILFLSQRTGRFGKPFMMYKFRSMKRGSERGAQSTAQSDPRVTRVGKLLRRLKLDELPQLVNIVKGEMSLVGPRPELPRYTALYSAEEKLILSVRPGLTDFSSLEFIQLADHLGCNDPDQTFEKKVLPLKNQLRLKYVKERSLVLDLKLILLTAYKLLFPKWSSSN